MRMKFYSLNTFYITHDIVEHSKIKSQLLEYINEMPDASINEEYQRLSKTDWFISKDHERLNSQRRKYLDFFKSIVTPYINNMCNELKFQEWNVDNVWYQVYNKGDTHAWHTHANTNYTNVYYLDLPDESIKTQIYDDITKSIVELEVHEGQLITFPASIKHRSPVNDTDQQKVIISFNSNFNNVNANELTN